MSYMRNITGESNFTLNVPAKQKFANVFGTDVSDATINVPGQAGFLTLGYGYNVTANLGMHGNLSATGGQNLDLTVGYGGVITAHHIYDSNVTVGEGGTANLIEVTDVTFEADAGKWGEGVTLVVNRPGGFFEGYLTNGADNVGVTMPAANNLDDNGFYLFLGDGSEMDTDSVTFSPATGGGSATAYLDGFDYNDKLIFAMPEGAESMQLTTLGRDVAAVVREIDADGNMIATITRLVGPGSYEPDGPPTGYGKSLIEDLFANSQFMHYHDSRSGGGGEGMIF